MRVITEKTYVYFFFLKKNFRKSSKYIYDAIHFREICRESNFLIPRNVYWENALHLLFPKNKISSNKAFMSSFIFAPSSYECGDVIELFETKYKAVTLTALTGIEDST